MYVITDRGNYVPVASITYVRPTKNGCVVYLTTGDSFKDKRDPSVLFSEVTNAPADFTVLAASVYKELLELKAGISTRLEELEAQVPKQLNALNATVGVVKDSVAAEAAKLDRATSKVTQKAQKLNIVADTIGSVSSKVSRVIENLEDAIDAI